MNWDEASKVMQSHGTPLPALGYCKIAFDMAAPQWVKVSDKLPPAEVPVIAYFVNEYGKRRRIKAFYAPRFAVETSVDGDWFEYNNESGDDDNAYLPMGWYECNEFEDTHWHVTAEVTHWMLLPLPPVAE